MRQAIVLITMAASMTFWRRVDSALAILLLCSTSTAIAMSDKERQAIDLSLYRVSDTDASYFDVQSRREILSTTNNSLLIQERDNIALGVSCRQVLAFPPITTVLRIPEIQSDSDGWRLASDPLFQFEDRMSDLAGAYVATGDRYYANCVGQVLHSWAEANALMQFHYSPTEQQTWQSLSSVISSMALAWSIVRPAVELTENVPNEVDSWLNRLAHHHASAGDGSTGNCCNNSLYARALYASMIGVLTNDNRLFRYAVGAIYSALDEMTIHGGLQRELERGRRATHHQNLALLYLLPTMEIIARQGYDLYEANPQNQSIKQAVTFALDAFEDPAVLGDAALLDQYKLFLQDDQFFAWMEVYQTRFNDPRVANFLQSRRPIYNAGAGGYVTLYYMGLGAQQHVMVEDDTVGDQQLNLITRTR